ncbi:MAG: cation:proton antiporter [Sarcina sp.]
MSHKFLLDLALILLSTKIFSILTSKLKLPQVVGALIAGVILGPTVLGLLKETDFINQLSSLGVIVLMFTAGLETDLSELKKTGKASLAAAILGVIIPLIGGTLIAMLFHEGTGSNVILKDIFVGIILTATSVSITVETLKELGKLSTRAGNTILGAALIDDILGIIGLTIVIGMADSTVSLGIVLVKILLFFIIAAIIGIVVRKVFLIWTTKHGKDMRRFVIMSFVLCLGLAYLAEDIFGVTDITGAFIGGMIISNTERTNFINKKFETLSYLLLSPIFFASIGIKLEVKSLDLYTIIFTIILIFIAVISKIIGGGAGVKIFSYSNREAIQVGAGMVSRGEVALIVASKGIAVGLMAEEFLVPVVIMVITTTILAPIILKIVFKNNDKKDVLSKDNKLMEDYVDIASERVE